MLPPKLPRFCDQFLTENTSKFDSFSSGGFEKIFCYTKLRFSSHDVTSDWIDWAPNKVCISLQWAMKGGSFLTLTRHFITGVSERKNHEMLEDLQVWGSCIQAVGGNLLSLDSTSCHHSLVFERPHAVFVSGWWLLSHRQLLISMVAPLERA